MRFDSINYGNTIQATYLKKSQVEWLRLFQNSGEGEVEMINPIFLLNTDYKIDAKSIVGRTKSVIESLIGLNSTFLRVQS